MKIQNRNSYKRLARSSLGSTIIETIVGLSISGLLLVGFVSEYANTLKFAHDEESKVSAMVRAQAVLESIGAELRILGNGVPYDQSNFQIAESTLSDPTVTNPIDLSTASNTNIAFKINETGEVHLLTANFDPASSLVLSITDTTGVEADDQFYLSNSVVGEDDGLFGEVQSVNHAAKTVTLKAGAVYSPGAVFNMGSIFERVPTVTYASTVNGITRDAGLGPVLMAKKSSMNIEYLDHTGATIALPLTEDILINNLRRIRVTVNVENDGRLRDGSVYTATVSQTFALRNLNYLF